MTAQWTPEERARKRRWLTGYLWSMVAAQQNQLRDPTLGPLTRLQAVRRLKERQPRIIERFAEIHGPEIAKLYDELQTEILREMERQSQN